MSKCKTESTPARMAASNPFLGPHDKPFIDVVAGTVSGDEASRIDFHGRLRYSLREPGGKIEIVLDEDEGIEAALDCIGNEGKRKLAFQVQGGATININAFLSVHVAGSVDADGHRGGWIRCVPERGGIEHGRNIPIDRAVFPVVNGPKLGRGGPVAYGTPAEIILCDSKPPDCNFSTIECTAWEWREWRIQIVEVRQPKKRGASWNERQGLAVTHCGEIHRSDGALFTMQDVEDAHLQTSLHLFLSFLKGTKVGVPIISGMGYGSPFCVSQHSVSQTPGHWGWFHGKMDKRLAADIFPAFCNELLHNHRLFLVKMQMYLDAMDSSAALQIKVLAAHGVLELALKDQEKDPGGPADLMQQAVDRAGFCNTDIPAYWKVGLSHADPKTLSVPRGREELQGTLSERLRHLRNQLTHMDFYRCEEKRRMWGDDCVITAWRCYTQLAELLLLRDLDYEGQYLVKEGGTEPRIGAVPWAAEGAAQ